MGQKWGFCCMATYENAVHVRTQVTTALLKLMETQEYQTISISDLAAAAQVSRSSVYRNFAGKDDVLRRHLKKLMEEWGRNFDVASGQDFSGSLLRHFYANREFYLLLYRSGLSWMIHENMKSACGLKADMPPILAYGAASIAGALFGWADEWLSRGMEETPEELEELAKKYEEGKQ